MTNRFINKLLSFAELTGDEIGLLEHATATPMRIGGRKDLIREGDKPGPMFVVLSGWAVRYKIMPAGTRQIIAFLMAGDACDLNVNMLAEMDHSIQTVGKAEVATISRTAMEELLGHAGIARAMYVAQLVDEGVLRAWIVSLGRRSSIERVAHLLLELYLRAARIGLKIGNTMDLPLSQVILADAVGMTPVHLNRVLQELRKRGAIELSRGRLHILDAATLTNIAGFDDNYLHKRMRQSARRTS